MARLVLATSAVHCDSQALYSTEKVFLCGQPIRFKEDMDPVTTGICLDPCLNLLAFLESHLGLKKLKHARCRSREVSEGVYSWFLPVSFLSLERGFRQDVAVCILRTDHMRLSCICNHESYLYLVKGWFYLRIFLNHETRLSFLRCTHIQIQCRPINL